MRESSTGKPMQLIRLRLNAKLTQTTFIISTLLLGLSVSPQTQVIRLSEPVARDAQSETFGSQWEATRSVVELADVLADVEQYVDQSLVIRTGIAKVCQKKGCLIIAQSGPHAVRVSFRDYGFFIPTDAAGKNVELAGELVRRELSEAEVAHFNQDAGESSGLAPGHVVEIVADGIRIPLAG